MLILADIGTVKDDKPVNLKSLPPEQQAKVQAKLKTTSCFGMKSGATTSLVKAENFCGTVAEDMPQQGLGQSYMPTKAAFHWQADRWAGLITRLQSAQAATMKNHHGTDGADSHGSAGRCTGYQRQLGVWHLCAPQRTGRSLEISCHANYLAEDKHSYAAQGVGPGGQV